MEALTNIQYELFMVLSTVCYFKYDTLTCHCFKSMKAKTTDAVMTDMSGGLLSSCTEHCDNMGHAVSIKNPFFFLLFHQLDNIFILHHMVLAHLLRVVLYRGAPNKCTERKS